MKAIKYKCRTCGKDWDTYQSGRMKYKTIFNTIDNCFMVLLRRRRRL